MTTCQELAPLLSLRATGALAPDEAARVEAHLHACAACRAEAAAEEDALNLAKLPPPSELERRATATLASDALARLRRTDARAAAWKRGGAAFAAAAALLLVVMAPAVLRKGPSSVVSGEGGERAVAASWEAPDLDTLWSDSDVLDVSGASAASSYGATTYYATAAYGTDGSAYGSNTYDAGEAALLAIDQ